MIDRDLVLQNNLSALLKEPFDIEGELYSSILKGLTSEQGILVPYRGNLPLVDVDNLAEAKVRNNLYNVPVSTKEGPYREFVRLDGEKFLNLKIEQKSAERELCEVIYNFEVTPHEHMDCLLKTFHSETQQKFVEMLNKNQFELAAERLKLWDIEITRKFDFYCLNYDELPQINFGVYNLYNLEQGLANFTSLIPNSKLFLGNDEYLSQLVKINKHLVATNRWIG